MIKFLFFPLLVFLLFTAIVYPQIESKKYLDGATVTAITYDGNYIWVATYDRGIFKYSKKEDKWTNFSTKNNVLDNDFFYTIAASKDYVWAGSVEGLFTYDKRREQWRKRKFGVGGEMGNWIRSLCYDSLQNILWIGRFKNLTRLDVAKQRYKDYNLTINKDAKTNTIISIKQDGDSLLWFGTEAGVHKFKKNMNIDDSKAWDFISNKNGGFNDEGNAVSVNDILFEKKNIWFATAQFITPEKPEFNVGGIYIYDRKLNWERISRNNGLPGSGIYCLERTGNKIWAAVYAFSKKEKKEYGKGLVLIDRITKSITPIDLNKTDIITSTILSLYFDGEYIWIGTDKGLWKIKISNPLSVWGGKKTSGSIKPGIKR